MGTIYEPHVTSALNDLVQPGSTVFDVGCNVGYLTETISTLVGPQGKVIAFEANSSIMSQLLTRLESISATNTRVENIAITDSDKTINFLTSAAHPQGGRIGEFEVSIQEGFSAKAVQARSLDSYCQEHQLIPSLIKMDIEGAELSALRGAQQLIAAHKPIFILEQHQGDGTLCMALLAELGYRAVDLKSWCHVDPAIGIVDAVVSDVLFFHETTPMPAHFIEVALGEPIYADLDQSQASVTQSVTLPPGRYLLKLDWDIVRDGLVQEYTWLDDAPLTRSDGDASWLQSSYLKITAALPHGGRLKSGVKTDGGDAQIAFRGMKVQEILPRSSFEAKTSAATWRASTPSNGLEQIDAPSKTTSLSEMLADKTDGEVFYQASLDAHRRMFGSRGGPYDIDYVEHFGAALSSAKYARQNMRGVPRFPGGREEVLRYAMDQVTTEGLILEFGVWSGHTINIVAEKRPNQPVYGFDSFQGLPDAWTGHMGEGHFAVERLPAVRENVELVVGLFDETLPGFLKKQTGSVALLHVDCDLYYSTQTVLTQLRKRIVRNTIIVFDEYMNYPGWELHEFLAFKQFVSYENLKYEYIAVSPASEQVAVRIL